MVDDNARLRRQNTDKVVAVLKSNADKVSIFVSDTCPFCAQALSALKGAEIPHDVIVVDDLIRSQLKELTGQTSVPSTWFGEQFLGGCNDGPEQWMGVMKLIGNGGLSKDGFQKPGSAASSITQDALTSAANISSSGANKRIFIGAVIYSVGIAIYYYMSSNGVEGPWKYSAATLLPFVVGSIVGIQGPTKTWYRMADGGMFEDENGNHTKVDNPDFVKTMKAKAASTMNKGVLLGVLSSFAAFQIKSNM